MNKLQIVARKYRLGNYAILFLFSIWLSVLNGITEEHGTLAEYQAKTAFYLIDAKAPGTTP